MLSEVLLWTMRGGHGTVGGPKGLGEYETDELIAEFPELTHPRTLSEFWQIDLDLRTNNDQVMFSGYNHTDSDVRLENRLLCQINATTK